VQGRQHAITRGEDLLERTTGDPRQVHITPTLEAPPHVADRRLALDLEPDMPIVLCDARSKDSAKEVLITLVEHVLVTASEEPLSGIA